MDMSNEQCVIGLRILALLNARKNQPGGGAFLPNHFTGTAYIEVLSRLVDLELIEPGPREYARITELGSTRFGQAMKTIGVFFDFDMDERLGRVVNKY